jgi:hypothetical protein
MTEELDVLRIISERLRAADVPFMLTGSFALGYYGKPRMDWPYLKDWAAKLGVAAKLDEVSK